MITLIDLFLSLRFIRKMLQAIGLEGEFNITTLFLTLTLAACETDVRIFLGFINNLSKLSNKYILQR